MDARAGSQVSRPIHCFALLVLPVLLGGCGTTGFRDKGDWTTIGPERNLLDPNPGSCHLIELQSPILTNEELAKLRHVAHGQFKSVTIPTLFDAKSGAKGLEKAMDEVCRQAGLHIDAGINLIILSDRGVDRNNAAIPPLLAGGSAGELLAVVAALCALAAVQAIARMVA